MTDELNNTNAVPADDQMPAMEDLWAIEDEAEEQDTLFEDDLGTEDMGPTVRVMLAGRSPIDVPLPGEGQSMTVATALDRANVAIRAGEQTVYVDGVQAGMETMVGVGQTIMPVGAVKGGK